MRMLARFSSTWRSFTFGFTTSASRVFWCESSHAPKGVSCSNPSLLRSWRQRLVSPYHSPVGQRCCIRVAEQCGCSPDSESHPGSHFAHFRRDPRCVCMRRVHCSKYRRRLSRSHPPLAGISPIIPLASRSPSDTPENQEGLRMLS